MPCPSARVTAAARTIGEQFAAWRKLQGLTAVQVSERAGISRNTLRRVETGDTGVGLQAFLSVPGPWACGCHGDSHGSLRDRPRSCSR